jgi:hypothetical protein
MSRTTTTTEHTSSEPKKAGCCGGDHTKHEDALSGQKRQTEPADDRKPEHTQDEHGGSCGCGSGKTGK